MSHSEPATINMEGPVCFLFRDPTGHWYARWWNTADGWMCANPPDDTTYLPQLGDVFPFITRNGHICDALDRAAPRLPFPPE